MLVQWPMINSSKALLFLSELEEVLELTQYNEFEVICAPLFRQVRSID